MNYHYATPEGHVVGPHSLEELRQLQQHGLLPASVMVCPEGASDWWPLESVLGSSPAADFATSVSGLPPSKPPLRPTSTDPSVQVLLGEKHTDHRPAAKAPRADDNLSLRRNLLQLAIVAVVTVLCAFTGWLMGGSPFSYGVGLLGLILGTIISGTVFMVIDLKNRS